MVSVCRISRATSHHFLSWKSEPQMVIILFIGTRDIEGQDKLFPEVLKSVFMTI